MKRLEDSARLEDLRVGDVRDLMCESLTRAVIPGGGWMALQVYDDGTSEEEEIVAWVAFDPEVYALIPYFAGHEGDGDWNAQKWDSSTALMWGPSAQPSAEKKAKAIEDLIKDRAETAKRRAEQAERKRAEAENLRSKGGGE